MNYQHKPKRRKSAWANKLLSFESLEARRLLAGDLLSDGVAVDEVWTVNLVQQCHQDDECESLEEDCLSNENLGVDTDCLYLLTLLPTGDGAGTSWDPMVTGRFGNDGQPQDQADGTNSPSQPPQEKSPASIEATAPQTVPQRLKFLNPVSLNSSVQTPSIPSEESLQLKITHNGYFNNDQLKIAHSVNQSSVRTGLIDNYQAFSVIEIDPAQSWTTNSLTSLEGTETSPSEVSNSRIKLLDSVAATSSSVFSNSMTSDFAQDLVDSIDEAMPSNLSVKPSEIVASESQNTTPIIDRPRQESKTKPNDQEKASLRKPAKVVKSMLFFSILVSNFAQQRKPDQPRRSSENSYSKI